MRKPYLMIALLAVLLLVVGGPAVLAQDTFVFCGDLAEADCQLLKDSQAAQMGLQSASMDLDVTLSVSNIPDAPFENLNFRLTGNGAFAIDPALMDSVMAYQDNPAALFADPEGFSQWLVDLITGISADLSLTLELPAEVTAMMSTPEQTIPETLSVDMVLVDGFGYINLEDIAAVMPEGDIPPGWMGADLAGFMQAAIEQSGGFGDMNEVDPSVFENYMNSFQDPAFMSEFMSVERLDDTEVAGQQAAVFQYTFDYAALFQSETFRQMMMAQMQAMSEVTGEEMDADAQAEMESALGMMGPMFEGITLEMRQVIGLDDKYTHTTEMHMAWDMTGMMSMMGEEAEGPAPNFTFDFVINTSNFNSAPEIVAPEDAMIVPLDTMIPSNNM